MTGVAVVQLKITNFPWEKILVHQMFIELLHGEHSFIDFQLHHCNTWCKALKMLMLSGAVGGAVRFFGAVTSATGGFMGIVSDTDIPVNENVKQMVVLYKAMVDETKKIYALMEKGSKVDKTRYLRLEIKVNALWLVMPREEHISAVEILVKDGYMDPRVADMLIIFGGKINQIEPKGHTLRI